MRALIVAAFVALWVAPAYAQQGAVVGAGAAQGRTAELALLIVTLDDFGNVHDKRSGSTDSRATDQATPNFDTLDQQGVRFSAAYVNPACATTRASLNLGQHNFRTGVYGPTAGNQLDDDTDHNLAKLARDVGGAETRAYGKYGLSGQTYGAWAKGGMGWNYFYGWPGVGLDGGGYRNWTLQTQDPAAFAAAAPAYTSTPPQSANQSEYVDDVMVSQLLADFSTRDKTRPFLAHIGLGNTRFPFHDPGMAAPAQTCDLPLVNYDCVALQVQKADALLGRLIDEINWSRTVMIVIGDNGIDGKSTLYEDGIRVPAYAYGGGLPTGTLSETMSVTDIYMTALDLMGVASYAGSAVMDGYSFADQIGFACGRTDSRCWSDRTGYVFSGKGNGARAWRDTLGSYPTYKLHHEGGAGGGAQELYNLNGYAGYGREATDLCGGNGDCTNLTGTDLAAHAALCASLDAFDPGMAVSCSGP